MTIDSLSKTKNTKGRLLIWDIGVRLSHMAMILLISISWWTGNEGGVYLQYHFWSGYCLLVIILFRTIWGFIGSTPARFSYFLQSPRVVFSFVRTLVRGKETRFLSHNPLGACMVIFLLATIFVQVTTGFFSDDELFNEGPFRKYVTGQIAGFLTNLHHLNFTVLLVLIAVHVVAVILHEIIKKDRLIWAMIIGRKKWDRNIPDFFFPKVIRLVISFLFSVVIVCSMIYLL